MSHPLLKKSYQEAKQYLWIQSLLLIGFSVLWLIVQSPLTGLSFFLGSFSVWIANIYFVYNVFSKAGAQNNKAVVKLFYWSESIKIFLSLSLLMLFFREMIGYEHYVLMGYIIAYLLQWISPVIIKTL
jgi:F0F1-type ATP synthase assembly protein I